MITIAVTIMIILMTIIAVKIITAIIKATTIIGIRMGQTVMKRAVLTMRIRSTRSTEHTQTHHHEIYEI